MSEEVKVASLPSQQLPRDPVLSQLNVAHIYIFHLISPSHLRLNGLRRLPTKISYAFLASPMCTRVYLV
jgi:hypothetical protein